MKPMSSTHSQYRTEWDLSRRGFLMSSLAAVATFPISPKAQDADGVLNFPSLIDEMQTWLKLRASLEDDDVYFWFRGKLDLAVPGEKVVTLVHLDGVNRRQVRRISETEHRVTLWEGVVFTDPVTGNITDSILNPLNNRTVEPLHYREGPIRMVFSPRGRHIVPTDDAPVPKTVNRLNLRWTASGDHVWAERETYGEFPHPLDARQWPLESSGDFIRGASVSLLKGRRSDLEDPRVVNAPVEFFYHATTQWLPWMLMGQQPGYVLYRGQGRKLTTLDDLLPAVRQRFDERHGPLFTSALWQEPTGVFIDHVNQRTPVVN